MNVAGTMSSAGLPLAGVVYLRQVYTLDAELNVLLVGASVDHLVEGSGEQLPAAVATEVRKRIATHDFKRRTVATCLVGAELGLRIVRARGPAGSFIPSLPNTSASGAGSESSAGTSH